ncbi:50S ribosomal protein L6 [Candidatus Pacearchaeota archaeon]|nr:50S ribosomal protein L6 [Candidatus Pacearchaeota archaeon]
MKKSLSQTIEIPAGVEVKQENGSVTVTGQEGEVKKKFNLGKLEFEVKDNNVFIGNKKSTKTEKKMMNTIAAHVRNMINGVQEKFEYKLKVCFSHFPMSVELKGDEVEIKNFLGENISRMVNVPKGAEVKIDGQIITISSVDREIAGQASANFETATKIKNKDQRVFQDGIYITHKAGREM